MDETKQLISISQANELVGKETSHPLVTVIDFSQHDKMEYGKMNLSFYGAFLKTTKNIDLQYGRHQYDYQAGTMIFIAPGQVVGFSNEKENKYYQPTGWALMFHPDLLHVPWLVEFTSSIISLMMFMKPFICQTMRKSL